jgi:spore germination protein D
MLRRFRIIAAALASFVLLASCGQESDSGGGNQISYKDVKSMVIDILETEEAQKIIQKASSTTAEGEGSLLMKGMTAQDQQTIKLAVKDVLTSPDYDKVIRELMTDPKFAGEFAKAVSKDNKQIHKDLMKDPSYQQDLIQIMKSPEAQIIITDALKTAEVRKQIMALVNEAIQSPLYKLELMKLLQSVVKEELMPKEDSQQQGGEKQKGQEQEQQGQDQEKKEEEQGSEGGEDGSA